jgi:enamine deaminase RidA (YjgF/YER057c/UK114 family)
LKIQIIFIVLLLSVSGLSTNSALAQAKAKDPETRIQELGIKLRTRGGNSSGSFIGAVRVGNLVYLSGQGPLIEDGKYVIGKVGKDLNFEEAKNAARLTGISMLEALKASVGNLNNVKRIVKVLGMVNAVPEFDNHSQVINGFSDLMVEVFGENGKHARSAIGLGSLPRNIPVEVEMIVEMKD